MASISPLKARPLRYPGESLDREIDSWVSETAMSYFIVAAMLSFLALMEWVGYLTRAPRSPILYSVFAALAIAAFIYRFARIRRRVRLLKLGRDGERCVGQFLERLREDDAQIFHDVPAEGFNLDHVVIAPQGIYVVETKTWSKPYPDARVTAADGKIKIAGFLPDRDPVAQAKAASRWLENLLKESTGKAYKVRPVVAFPGWFVEQVEPAGEVWVIEPKMLPAMVGREPSRLVTSDVKLAAFHLSRYIRGQAANSA